MSVRERSVNQDLCPPYALDGRPGVEIHRRARLDVPDGARVPVQGELAIAP